MHAALFTLLSVLSQSPCLAFTAPSQATWGAQVRSGEMSTSAQPAFGKAFGNPTPTPIPEPEQFEKDPGFLGPVADGVSDVVILGLRVGTCVLMVHHGFDKIEHVDGFTANVVDKFFGFLPGPGKFWTLSAAGTQIVGAGLLGVGVLARPVALSMCATMVTAVIFHLLNTGGEGFPLGVPAAHSYNFELAAMYVAVLTYFTAAGAGAYSVDEKLLGGELQLYEGLWEKVSGGKGESE